MKDHDSTNDRILLFFEVCAKIEGLCADLYHYYSDIYAENTYAARILRKTALEEENHQKQFELVSRLREDVKFDVKTDIGRSRRVYDKLIKLLEHVRQSPPDIVTALTKAIEMEESLADLHLESSVRFHDESVIRMFEALREFDQNHVAALRHCLSVMMLPNAEMAG